MTLFLLFAVIFWLAVFCIYLIERETFTVSRGGKYHRLSLNRSCRLILRSSYARVIPVVLVMIAVAIMAIIGTALLTRGNHFNSIYDFLVSPQMAQIVLGSIFGTLLGGWSTRLYRRKNTDTLSLAEKVGGIALLMLFVFGTTSVSLEEWIRGVSYDKDGIAFRLSPLKPAEAAGAAGVGPAPIVPPKNSGEIGTKDSLGGQWGIITLASLHEFMRRDLAIMKANPLSVPGKTTIGELDASLTLAASAYEKKFASIAACLRSLVSAVGDDQYLRDLLRDLKPAIRELHLQSLADVPTSDPTMKATETRIQISLARLVSRINDHHESVLAGLRILDPAVDQRLQCGRRVEVADTSIVMDGFQARPYLAILYAALLQLEDQELAAVETLDDWLRVRQEPENSWFRIRVMLTKFTILETMFRRQPDQPDIVIEELLRVSRTLVETLQRDAYVQTAWDQTLGKARMGFVESQFDVDIASAEPCMSVPRDLSRGVAPIVANKVSLSYLLYNTKFVFVRRALDHSRFGDVYYQKANDYLDEIVEADPACLPLISGMEGTATIRGETLMVYARFQYMQASLRAPIGPRPREAAERDLTRALSALRLAKAIVGHQVTSASSSQSRRVSQILNRNSVARLDSRLGTLIDDYSQELARLSARR